MRANETYSEAKRQFSDRNRDVLINVETMNSVLNDELGVRLEFIIASAR